MTRKSRVSLICSKWILEILLILFLMPLLMAAAPKVWEPAAKPIYTGVFDVALILIRFQDTEFEGSPKDLKEKLFTIKGVSLERYFKEYSNGVTWPQGEMILPGSGANQVYTAPHPLGYYCYFDHYTNYIGYKTDEEGAKRTAELRKTALQYAFQGYKGRKLDQNKDQKIDAVCFIYETELLGKSALEPLLTPLHTQNTYLNKPHWKHYAPKVRYGDGLWPHAGTMSGKTPAGNASAYIQVSTGSGGSTIAHELGHTLGAPDFYRYPSRLDGDPGTPCLPWSYGPTGPAYCRWFYNAFLPIKHYPSLTADGTYTLSPRGTHPVDNEALGYIVPSAHPNYLYLLEYVNDKASFIGNPDQTGLLISVLNTAIENSYMGAPDLYYIYRPNDPWFRGGGDLSDALFGKTHGRTAFNMKTDPACRLPNLLDGGIELSEIDEKGETLTFSLKVPNSKISGSRLKQSLLHKIMIDTVIDLQPTSFKMESTVIFRGEPLKTEYGFCWGTSKKSNATPKNSFALCNRDRYSGRALGLKPNTQYYVRAYVKSPLGLTYSAEEIAIKTPSLKTEQSEIAPLLDDKFSCCWFLEKSFSVPQDNEGYDGGYSAFAVIGKLFNYYRMPEKFKKGIPGFDAKEKIDYSKIHIAPSDEVPPFRCAETKKLFNLARAIITLTGMDQRKLPADFFSPKMIKKIGFKCKPSLMRLSQFSEEKILNAIRSELEASRPVLGGHEPLISSKLYKTQWVIIDGIRKDNTVHIVFSPRDRHFDRETGWYPISILQEECNDYFVIPGLVPIQ